LGAIVETADESNPPFPVTTGRLYVYGDIGLILLKIPRRKFRTGTIQKILAQSKSDNSLAKKERVTGFDKGEDYPLDRLRFSAGQLPQTIPVLLSSSKVNIISFGQYKD
jgi:hypothetical protein